MTKSKLFFWFSLSFISGIGAASFYYPHLAEKSLLLIFLSLALTISVVFYGNSRVIFFSFLVIFFLGGFFLTTQRLGIIEKATLENLKFSGVARVVVPTQEKSFFQTFTVSLEKYSETRVLIATGKTPAYNYGDKIELECVLGIPKNKDSEFDYRMYLASQKTDYECQSPRIQKIEEEKSFSFLGALYDLKEKIKENIARLLPAPQSGLLSGLLIGGNDLLPKEIQEAFSRTSLTHVVAVSGYNVAIIAEYLMIFGIFIGFWRRYAFYLALAGIIIFVILTGASASAVRAGIMGILLIWAIKNARLGNSQNAILFSASVMLMANPLLLRYDVGFQLSFLATLGIIYLYPFLSSYLVKKNKIQGVAEILFLTVAAQIFVLPVIIFNFKNLSLISLAANLAVLPIIPLTMMLGFLMVATSFLFFPLAQIFSWLAYLPLYYEIEAVKFFSSFHFAAMEMKIERWQVVFWYFVLYLLISFARRNRKKICPEEN